MAQVRMLTIEAEPLTADAWAAFGWLPRADTDPADGAQTLHFEWADPHLNVIAHAYDEIEHSARGAICSVMYRHDTHTQALMPLNCRSWIAVAPAFVDFSYAAQVESVRAFLLDPLSCIVLHRGTWHAGPFPLGSEPVRMLNLQGRRYEEDNAYVDVDRATGMRVVVRAGD